MGAGLANFVGDFFTDQSESSSGNGSDVPGSAAILADVVVYSNQTLLAKYSIEHGEYIIGRDSTCHILVDADQVSRHHARLTLSGFELVIEDVGSSNGVFIDGVQVQIPTRVRPDQEVQIGSARLRIGLKESASRQLAEALWDKDLGLEAVRQMLEAKKYRVITTIARGGMGVVMQARDLRIRRTVAMKVMKTSTQFSRENVLRFIDEAQLTGQLEHPNIVPVYELGLDEQGETFYAMKFVKGITLDDVLRGLRSGKPKMLAKYPLATLITIFLKICDGVAFAHSKGVVHRDLKPENVMIGAYGEVLVMDWGLAKNMTASPRPAEPALPAPVEPEPQPIADARGFQTMHGIIIGTPPYISPEQARGDLEKIDTRSDIFVLGEILYSILTLRPPVAGDTVSEVVEKILGGQIVSPSSFNKVPKPSRRATVNPARDSYISLSHCPGRRVPEGLSAVAMKAMEMETEARYQSVVEMQVDIAAWQGGFATKAERAGMGTHLRLFVARHKAAVAILAVLAVVFNLVVAGFIYKLSEEKNRALASEKLTLANAQKAMEREKVVAERLTALRGTAPVYYLESQTLLDDREFAEALSRIDFAVAQVPNEADYHALRGDILQSLWRLEDALLAYRRALKCDAGHEGAARNMEVTRRIAAMIPPGAKPTPNALLTLHGALLEQNRVGEAVELLKQLPSSQKVFGDTWRAFFKKHRLAAPVITAEQTLNVDLSQSDASDLSVLAGAPVHELKLDGCAQLQSLKPLMELPVLEAVLLPSQIKDIGFLREHPTLKRISYKNIRQSAADFWAEYDAANSAPKVSEPRAAEPKAKDGVDDGVEPKVGAPE